jgi:hypothetical protein
MTTNWTSEQQKEHRKLWVEALRSGKYKQAQSCLRNHRGAMCCLGVACEISGLGSFKSDGVFVDTEGRSSDQNLTPLVKSWLGLKGEGGAWGDDGKSLWYRNDHGAPFSDIADIIESEPEGLIAS